MVLKKALSRGIVHRDLKPEHVIISQDGKVTIVDWEFSARLDIKPNVSVGTLDYTPPEGKMGAGELKLTENYDVYSLGVMLLEMLTGKPYGTFALKNENLRKLLEEMTSSEPKNRVNIDKVIKSLKQMYIKEREVKGR
jgi:serine/threonine protein kinase